MPEFSLELSHLGLQYLQVIGYGVVCLYKLTTLRVQSSVWDAKPISPIDDRKTSSDDLFDRFIIELKGIQSAPFVFLYLSFDIIIWLLI